ncbi:MAG: EAL domain-containing protein [Pseudomonadota bacterium]
MSSDDIDHNTQKELILQSGIVLFKWDKKSDAISIDTALNRLFPYNDISLPTGLSFYRRVHKDDRINLRKIIQSGEFSGGQDFDIRLLLNTGETIWMRLNFLNNHPHKGKYIYGSAQNITKDKYDLLRTAYTAYTDDLTGLLNRPRMKQKIALAIGAASQYNVRSMFLTIAIDNLAAINNMFGHHVADDIIQAVGRCLVTSKRKSDVIARLSSGKFGILLTDVKTDNMEEIGNRFLKSIRDTSFITRSGSICITASGGGCVISQDADTIDTAFSLADECLSISKKRGRNSFIAFKPEFTRHEERKENIILSSEIVRSIQEGRVCPAFQPIINPKAPEKSFIEMLARIKNHDGTLIPAYKFIPIAENTGFIRMIDMQILNTALHILDQTDDINLSVNLSGHTLSNPSLTDEIVSKLSLYRHVATRLIIEITETVALQDIHDMKNFMENIRQLGFRVALDDFGAGYNSFSNLKSYPFNIVKIDGGYIRGIDKDPRNQIFVEAFCVMADKLGLEIVAEMVSEPEEVTILKNFPIDYYQGYLYGKPEMELETSIKNMQSSLQGFVVPVKKPKLRRAK